MKKLLSTLIVLLMHMHLQTQDSIYTYYEKDSIQIVSNGPGVFIYGKQKKTPTGFEKNVNERRYKLSLTKTKDGKNM